MMRVTLLLLFLALLAINTEARKKSSSDEVYITYNRIREKLLIRSYNELHRAQLPQRYKRRR